MSDDGGSTGWAEAVRGDDPVARYYAALEARDWAGVAALLHPDVVYTMPQSGEWVQGRATYLRFNQDYPGEWHLRLERLAVDGRVRAAWVVATTDGVPSLNLAWFTLDDDGLVVRIDDVWPEPFTPPTHRPDYVERQPA